MTIVLSSSSPTASVALFNDGRLLAKGSAPARMKASGMLVTLLDNCLSEAGKTLGDAMLFVADVGPGSFTGVKVAVTMAKSFAFAGHKQVAGVTAFDLVDRAGCVALPSKKGEWFVREPGMSPRIELEVPHGCKQGVDPLAELAGPMLAGLIAVDPETLVPLYVAEPSISKPRDRRILDGPNA